MGSGRWACNRALPGGFCLSPTPVRVRLVFSAVCLATFAACAPPSSRPDSAPVLTGPVAESTQALVARLVPTALGASFRRLAATAYEARVVVEETDESGQRVGRFERVVQHTPGAADRMLVARASGTLADTAGLGLARLTDPLPSVLSDTPAYVAPSTRDQYTVRTGSAGGSVRQVDIEHTADTEQAVERVTAAIDVATGDVLRVAVARLSRSAIYDEATRTEVRLRRATGGPVPFAVETTSTVSTPLSGTSTYRVTWQVRPPGTRPSS